MELRKWRTLVVGADVQNLPAEPFGEVLEAKPVEGRQLLPAKAISGTPTTWPPGVGAESPVRSFLTS